MRRKNNFSVFQVASMNQSEVLFKGCIWRCLGLFLAMEHQWLPLSAPVAGWKDLAPFGPCLRAALSW